MPIDGFHTARQMDPARCDKIRRQEVTAGVSFNYCVIKGKAEVQSVHFDARKFTVEEAKAWLKAHDFKADQFEPATGSADAAKAQAIAEIAAMSFPSEIRCGYAGGEAGPAVEIEAQAAGASEGLSRFKIVGYTGVPMKLPGFPLPVVADLETLKARQTIPILRDHDLERIAGHTDRIDITPQMLVASGVLSGTPEQTKDVIHTARNRFPWQASIGAQLMGRPQYVPDGESAKVNGRTWRGPVLIARNAHLRELTLTSVGADGNTEAAFSAG